MASNVNTNLKTLYPRQIKGIAPIDTPDDWRADVLQGERLKATAKNRLKTFCRLYVLPYIELAEWLLHRPAAQVVIQFAKAAYHMAVLAALFLTTIMVWVALS